jgi:hypothetical protein
MKRRGNFGKMRFRVETLEERIALSATGTALGEFIQNSPYTQGQADRGGPEQSIGQQVCSHFVEEPGGCPETVESIIQPPGLEHAE